MRFKKIYPILYNLHNGKNYEKYNTFFKKNINKIKENDKIGNFLGWPKMMCSYYT